MYKRPSIDRRPLADYRAQKPAQKGDPFKGGPCTERRLLVEGSPCRESLCTERTNLVDKTICTERRSFKKRINGQVLCAEWRPLVLEALCTKRSPFVDETICTVS